MYRNRTVKDCFEALLNSCGAQQSIFLAQSTDGFLLEITVFPSIADNISHIKFIHER